MKLSPAFTSQVAAVFKTVSEFSQAHLREIDPNAGVWNSGALLETLKEKLCDLFNWCEEHHDEISRVLQMSGAALSNSSHPNIKVVGMALSATGALLGTVVGHRHKLEHSAPEARGGPPFDGCALVYML